MEEKKERVWETLHRIKEKLVCDICQILDERTIDLSEENVYVFAIEHHCNEGLWGELGTISKEGFTMDGDADELRWHDMIVEDLAMVLDYLRTGSW